MKKSNTMTVTGTVVKFKPSFKYPGKILMEIKISLVDALGFEAAREVNYNYVLAYHVDDIKSLVDKFVNKRITANLLQSPAKENFYAIDNSTIKEVK